MLNALGDQARAWDSQAVHHLLERPTILVADAHSQLPARLAQEVLGELTDRWALFVVNNVVAPLPIVDQSLQ